MSKRRLGFPSETQVKRGVRIVHGDKLLEEKLGRNDLCPCGSGQRFKKCCLKKGGFRWREPGSLLLGTENLWPARFNLTGRVFVCQACFVCRRCKSSGGRDERNLAVKDRVSVVRRNLKGAESTTRTRRTEIGYKADRLG